MNENFHMTAANHKIYYREAVVLYVLINEVDEVSFPYYK